MSSRTPAARDLERIERLGLRLAREASDRIRRVAVKGLLTRKAGPSVRVLMGARLTKFISQSMQAAYLKGRRRVVFSARHASVKLSNPLQGLLAVLKRNEDIDFIDGLEERLDSRALRIMEEASDRVETELRKGLNEIIAEQLPTGAAKKRLGEVFDRLGLSPFNSYQLENIVRTQSRLAYGAAKWEAEQDPDIQEILWGYEYTTVGDSRVRPSHAELDGVRLPKEHPFWSTYYPPNGYSCRCEVIPIFTPEAEKFPPSDAELPDDGFRFNPGELINQ